MKHKRYIYALFSSENPDRIYYVGQTANVMVRYERHLGGFDASTQRWVKRTKAKGHCVRFIILESTNARIASEREGWWISILHPHLNFVGRGFLRVAPKIEAWNYTRVLWVEKNLVFGSALEAGRATGFSKHTVNRALKEGGRIFWHPGVTFREIAPPDGVAQSLETLSQASK